MHQNTKFGWGCAPDPLGSLQRSRRPLAGFKGATSKERGGEGEEWRGGMEGGCCGVRKILKIDHG